MRTITSFHPQRERHLQSAKPSLGAAHPRFLNIFRSKSSFFSHFLIIVTFLILTTIIAFLTLLLLFLVLILVNDHHRSHPAHNRLPRGRVVGDPAQFETLRGSEEQQRLPANHHRLISSPNNMMFAAFPFLSKINQTAYFLWHTTSRAIPSG